jgi:hypothetical protein
MRLVSQDRVGSGAVDLLATLNLVDKRRLIPYAGGHPPRHFWRGGDQDCHHGPVLFFQARVRTRSTHTTSSPGSQITDVLRHPGQARNFDSNSRWVPEMPLDKRSPLPQIERRAMPRARASGGTRPLPSAAGRGPATTDPTCQYRHRPAPDQCRQVDMRTETEPTTPNEALSVCTHCQQGLVFGFLSIRSPRGEARRAFRADKRHP